MSQHTPAPWVLSKAHSARVDLINTKKGDAIGEIVFADVRNPADARLIAAAPDLLDALQWITRCASIDGSVGTTAYIISDKRMAEVRAAIAKATGVQS